MKQCLSVILILSILFPDKTIASDTTKIKRGLSMSVNAGYTSNTVYGSMVERNNEFGKNVKMENRGGYIFLVNVEKYVSKLIYLKTGIGFIQKEVDPMVNTYSIYKDKLKTGYIAIPIEIGINLLPSGSFLNLDLTIGTNTNFAAVDKSYSGPDRVGFKTSFLTESVSGGVKLSFSENSNVIPFLQYNYTQDIPNSYIETLYWNSAEPNKKFYYSYKTDVISIGLLWKIKKD